MTCQELLTVILVLRHFRPYLYGERFLLHSDHASLTWLLNFKEQLTCLVDFEIRHWAGRLHTNTDALSRCPCDEEDCRHCHRVRSGHSGGGPAYCFLRQ